VIIAVIIAISVLIPMRKITTRHLLWLVPIIHLTIGVAITHYALQAMATIRSAEWFRSVAVGTVILLMMVPFGATAAAADSPTLGTDLNTSTEIVKQTIEEEEDTTILTVTPWGEFILKAYGVEEPIHGLPVDAVGEPYIARRTRGDYDPQNHPEDRERLHQLVADHDVVIVYVSHAFGNGRLEPLNSDLEDLGFNESQHFQTRSNGVLVYTN